MLVIRPEQLDYLDQKASEGFVDKLKQDLRSHYPEQFASLSDSTHDRLVQGALEKARQHGLTWESSLALFVHLMASVGPNFDQHPTVREALSHPEMTPDVCMSILVGMVPLNVWEDIRKAPSNSTYAWPYPTGNGAPE